MHPILLLPESHASIETVSRRRQIGHYWLLIHDVEKLHLKLSLKADQCGR